MNVVTLQQLKDLGACSEQLQLFEEKFGESVVVTLELCMEFAQEFGFRWASRHLLPPKWQKEFDRVCDPARAESHRVCVAAEMEYDRVCAVARVEFRRVCDPAQPEYVQVCNAAWAEYRRVCAAARVESRRVCNAGWVEFARVRAVVWAKEFLASNSGK